MAGSVRWPVITLVCLLTLAGAPRAEAAERYVDEVFSSVDVTSNIAYGEAPDELGQPETLLLDLYQPAGDTMTGRPVVVFVHGGSFTGGDKAGANNVNYVTQLAKRGVVTASINYRLREGGYPPEEQFQVVLDAKHDAQAAVRWFRANAATYDIDPGRISIAGYSAGAATALFTGYTSNDPGDSGNPGYPSDVSAVIDVSGGMGALADDVIEAGEPPVLIVHSTNDATVPYSNAEEIIAAAQAVGIPYELHAVAAGHSKFGLLTDDIAEWSGVFLYNQVIAGGAVGGLADVPDIAAPRAGRTGRIPLLLVLGIVALATVSALAFVRRPTPATPSAPSR